MFDIKWIRENAQAFDNAMARRGLDPQSAGLIELDEKRRQLQFEAQEIQAERNKLSKEVGALKAKGEDAEDLIAKVSRTKDAEAEVARPVEESAAEANADTPVFDEGQSAEAGAVVAPPEVDDAAPEAPEEVTAIPDAGEAPISEEPAQPQDEVPVDKVSDEETPIGTAPDAVAATVVVVAAVAAMTGVVTGAATAMAAPATARRMCRTS